MINKLFSPEIHLQLCVLLSQKEGRKMFLICALDVRVSEAMVTSGLVHSPGFERGHLDHRQLEESSLSESDAPQLSLSPRVI